MTRRHTEMTIAGLASLTAVNAFGGAVYGLTGAPRVPREWLEGSPFRSYRVPSLMLGVAVGGTSARSAVTAWRGSESAGRSSIIAGVTLTGWIAAQVAIIGPRSILQPVMAGVGLAMTVLGRNLDS